MLINYRTGKGADQLAPVIFPTETIRAMKLLTDYKICKEAGIREDNPYYIWLALPQ